MDKYPVMIGIKMTEEEAKTVREAAEAEGRSISNFLRRLITEELKKLKK